MTWISSLCRGCLSFSFILFSWPIDQKWKIIPFHILFRPLQFILSCFISVFIFLLPLPPSLTCYLSSLSFSYLASLSSLFIWLSAFYSFHLLPFSLLFSSIILSFLLFICSFSFSLPFSSLICSFSSILLLFSCFLLFFPNLLFFFFFPLWFSPLSLSSSYDGPYIY